MPSLGSARGRRTRILTPDALATLAEVTSDRNRIDPVARSLIYVSTGALTRRGPLGRIERRRSRSVGGGDADDADDADDRTLFGPSFTEESAYATSEVRPSRFDSTWSRAGGDTYVVRTYYVGY